MVVFNYSGAELNAKVVYYGPALSGKTTNLEFIYERMPDDTKGKMVSMKTRTDRTLFFDFLPLDVGEINGYRTRILLYTVPGQVYYNATRKLVLKGADAVVFVADSQASKMEENIESLRNLEENLNEHGLTLDTMPWVIQYNKRDLPDALPIEALNNKLNLLNVPSYEAVATTGHGIYETFRAIAGLLYRQLVERLKNTQPAPRVGAGVQASPEAPQTETPPAPQPVAADQSMPQATAPQPPAPQPSPERQPALAQTAAPQPVATQTTEPRPANVRTPESQTVARLAPGSQPADAQTMQKPPAVPEATESQPLKPQETQQPPEPPDSAAQQPQTESPAAPPQPGPELSDDVSDVIDAAFREVGENEEPDTARVTATTPVEPEKTQKTPRRPLEQDGTDTEKKMDDSLDKEFQFAPLESSRDLDKDVGRVIDFDDPQPEEPVDSQEREFIVDPFHSKTAETVETPEAEEKKPEEAASPAPASASPTPAQPPPAAASPAPAQPSPTASQDHKPVTVTVPVYLKRSQVRKSIKIELEIQIDDEEF